ncbi:MAG: Yip1 family protein [Candidatus Sphingomonas colombiensis]|nr:Yip1 family protein [Sphingomonas sp.]WEK44188.1 MAG: Yip1 family protein [Sphingomonas sp.]
MTSQLPQDRASSLIERARRIILQPKEEWPAIDAEPMTVKGIMTGWAVPLAAIGPVAGLIGSLTFGYSILGITWRPSIGGAVTTAVISYALALLGVWVISLIIDALAPTFGGTKNPVSATKVAAYSMTAGWLAGIFQIIPMLSFLGLLGLYSLYLLYLGLPRLMRAPEDKAMGYTLATIVAAIVVMVVISFATTAVTSSLMRPAFNAGTMSGAVSVPGVGSLDLGKLDAASKQMEAAANNMAANAKAGTPASLTPTATLQAFLPETIGGWKRGDVETASGGAGGIGGSKAEARYTLGNDTITLSVADVAAMGALAGLGQALNVQSNRETKDGYERTATVDGRMTTEKWDGASRNGEYNVIVGNRFAVSAEGSAPDAAAFKAIVAAVDLGKLDALAKN